MSRGIQIGATLRAARKRGGLTIAALEERTHIRTRYLRALEAESWSELPSDTYARAFLQTYADELGLDADALVDELRLRQGGRVGGAEDLITAQIGSERPPSRLLVGSLALGIVLLLFVLAFAGREDDETSPAEGGANRSGQDRNGGRQGGRSGSARPARAPMTLTPLTAARVCVSRGRKALVDRQILATGNRERFDAARRFTVDLEFGEIRVRTLDERTRLRADSAGEPLSVIVRPGQIRRVSYTGDSCP